MSKYSKTRYNTFIGEQRTKCRFPIRLLAAIWILLLVFNHQNHVRNGFLTWNNHKMIYYTFYCRNMLKINVFNKDAYSHWRPSWIFTWYWPQIIKMMLEMDSLHAITLLNDVLSKGIRISKSKCSKWPLAARLDFRFRLGFEKMHLQTSWRWRWRSQELKSSFKTSGG